MKRPLFVCTLLLAQSFAAFAQEKSNIFVDYVDYEDYVYSQSKKTELGDQIELEMAVKYVYSTSTYARFRFQTRPEDNRENNKTDRFELALGHNYENISVGLDLELLTNDGTKGGTALSFDLDSDDTFISWQASDQFKMTFLPFNFDGEVGEEFNTWDVTRIYFVDGTLPGGTVGGTVTAGQKIVEKTIPGLVFSTKPTLTSELYAGFGVASYIYPANTNFNLETNATVTRLERKQDFGYKLGGSYKTENLRAKLEYVGHSESEETGALLESAASTYAIARVSSLILEGEVTISKAGKNAYDVSRSTGWFSQTTPFLPIYSNYLGTARQSWLGKTDAAYSLRVGLEMDKTTPYVFARYQGEHFVFNEKESAHLLRTNDLNKSHGGLWRLGGGAFFRYGDNFVINPDFELRKAQNPVFANSSDVRDDRYLGNFKKNDFLITLFVTYDFDGNAVFKP
jgi:hypothetical protein